MINKESAVEKVIIFSTGRFIIAGFALLVLSAIPQAVGINILPYVASGLAISLAIIFAVKTECLAWLAQDWLMRTHTQDPCEGKKVWYFQDASTVYHYHLASASLAVISAIMVVAFDATQTLVLFIPVLFLFIALGTVYLLLATLDHYGGVVSAALEGRPYAKMPGT